ncbi:MAG: hypothetical protein IFNCLDLE_01501 [Ignavibacteriaceae bacterium]|nr:hypothetical protein [Ignavibacteriaceae bacterium]
MSSDFKNYHNYGKITTHCDKSKPNSSKLSLNLDKLKPHSDKLSLNNDQLTLDYGKSFKYRKSTQKNRLL